MSLKLDDRDVNCLAKPMYTIVMACIIWKASPLIQQMFLGLIMAFMKAVTFIYVMVNTYNTI
jgi:hypothetical protein